MLHTIVLSITLSLGQTDPGVHASNYKHPQKAKKASMGYFESRKEARLQQRNYKQVQQVGVAVTTDAVQPPQLLAKKAHYKKAF